MAPQVKGIAARAYKHGPMQAMKQAMVTCHSGVANDVRGKPSQRQVTLLSEASWLQVCAQWQHAHPELSAAAMPSWLMRRANILISEKIFHPTDIGATVRMGQCVLEITQACEPCYKMNQQRYGLQALLTPGFTAGVCCKVLSGGPIHLGDTVMITPPPQQNRLI